MRRTASRETRHRVRPSQIPGKVGCCGRPADRRFVHRQLENNHRALVEDTPFMSSKPMSLKIERVPLERLQQILPRLLSSLSIGRAQIALEQIRSTLQHRPHDEIIFLMASDLTTSEQPLAAVIAMEQAAVAPHPRSDVATIVHAGFLLETPLSVPPSASHDQNEPSLENLSKPADSVAVGPLPDEESIIRQLQIHLDRHLEQRGIRFVQWATDTAEQAGPSSSRWYSGLGFDQIAMLDYLSGNTADRYKDADPRQNEANPLNFCPIPWDQSSDLDSFAKLVESTYIDTLDCPGLAEYRTAAETLRGYQTVPAFAPTLWFRVRDSEDPSASPIGCLILAKHGDPPQNQNHGDQSAPDQANPSGEPVFEIVYMGIVPKARGRGYGKHLVDRTFAAVTDAGGTRVILGVDRANTPARAIYDRMGLSCILSETIWVRKIDLVKSRQQ